MTASVRAWASIDTSILLELSGGLDSSIVAACLCDCEADITCYNLVTPVPGVDERHYASLMASQLAVPLHTEHLELDGARFDFDVAASVFTPGVGLLQFAIDQIMERAANRHGTAAYYSGGGGDSVFCYLRTRPRPPMHSGQPEQHVGSRPLGIWHNCTSAPSGKPPV